MIQIELNHDNLLLAFAYHLHVQNSSGMFIIISFCFGGFNRVISERAVKAMRMFELRPQDCKKKCKRFVCSASRHLLRKYRPMHTTV